VLVDVHSYEESQETLALLQILVIGKQQVEAGQTYPLSEVIEKIRNRRPAGKGHPAAKGGDGASSAEPTSA
jgi:hypothetical protein